MFKLKTNLNTTICNSTEELLSALIIPNDKAVLIIIRGLVGSGKSTLAKAICEKFNNISHYEADMYFQCGSIYNFDKTKLSLAHDWCYNKVIDDLLKGKTVLVANTFVRRWEMEKYILAAKKLKIDLVIIECLAEYNNIHGVPKETIERMRQQWDEF